MERDPADKPVALVTGASSGLGDSIVRRLAAGGFRVLAVARRRERLERLARELARAGEVETLALDVTSDGAAERAVRAATQAFGRLDCLVNNAGAGMWGRVGDTDDATLDAMIEIGLKAPFRFCRAAVQVMGAGSSIINIGSTFGLVGGLKSAAYCATKAGLIGLTQSLAVDYGARGIRANLIAPGVIRTEMTEASWDTDWFRRTNQEMTPFHRNGTARDVANVVCFLASEEGSYVHGQVIALDGGWTSTKYLSREALTCERVAQAAPEGGGR